MMRIMVTGASGRMGSALCDYLAGVPEVEALPVNHPAGEGETTRVAALEAAVGGDKVDAMVDFTYPEATFIHAAWAAARGLPMVIGTTGFTLSGLDRLAEILEPVPVLLSPNLSLMMNLVWRMTANAARALPQSGIDVEIIEKHHRQKRNAPSSTAMKLAQIVAEKRGWSLAGSLRHEARWGLIGERPDKEIAISSLRGGTFNSEHTIIFAGSGESLEITHRSQSLEPFARGALRSARWLVNQSPGVYDMLDMLGLAEVLY